MVRVPMLVISGPVGVGRSTLGDEVSAPLSARGVPHTVVDLDALAATSGRHPPDIAAERVEVVSWVEAG